MNLSRATLIKLWLLHVSLYGAGATIALRGVSPLRYWMSAVPFGLSLAVSSVSFIGAAVSPAEIEETKEKERPINRMGRQPLYNFESDAPLVASKRKKRKPADPDVLTHNRLGLRITKRQLARVIDVVFSQRANLTHESTRGYFRRSPNARPPINQLKEFKLDCFKNKLAYEGPKKNTIRFNAAGIRHLGNLANKNEIDVSMWKVKDYKNLTPAPPPEPDCTAPTGHVRTGTQEHNKTHIIFNPDRYRDSHYKPVIKARLQ